MLSKPRRRTPDLDLKGRIRFAPSPEQTATTYPAIICDLTGQGAMIMVDLPCGTRLHLFEKVRHCLLEFEEPGGPPHQILTKAVWLQPQTSAGDFMTFRIGLAFEQLTPDQSIRIREYALRLKNSMQSSMPAYTPDPRLGHPAR